MSQCEFLGTISDIPENSLKTRYPAPACGNAATVDTARRQPPVLSVAWALLPEIKVCRARVPNLRVGEPKPLAHTTLVHPKTIDEQLHKSTADDFVIWQPQVLGRAVRNDGS